MKISNSTFFDICRKYYAVVLLFFIVFLIGCGKISSDENSIGRRIISNETKYMYEIAEMSLTDVDYNKSISYNSRGILYIKKSNSENESLTYESVIDGLKKQVFIAENDSHIIDTDMDENGKIALVVRSFDFVSNSILYSIHVLDTEYKELLSKNITDFLDDDYITSVIIRDSSVFVLFGKGFVEYDFRGEILNTYLYKNDEQNARVVVSTTEIILYGDAGYGSWYKVIDKATYEELRFFTSPQKIVWEGGYSSLYYFDTEGLVKVCYNDEADKQILSFSDVDINKRTIKCIIDEIEGVYYAWVFDNGDYQFMTIRPDDEMAMEDSREKLALLCLNGSMFQGSVNKYNSLSEKSVIDILPEASTVDMFRLEVATKEYDLVEIPGNYTELVKKGYLSPLNDFIDSSEIVSREDYFSWMLEDLTIDGNIYAIPREMSLSCLWGPEELFTDSTSWDIYTFFEFLNKYPGALSVPDEDIADIKQRITAYALYGSLEDIIDEDRRLDRNLLEYILRETEKLDIDRTNASVEKRLKDGEAVLLLSYIGGADELARLQSEVGRKLKPLGFPSFNAGSSGGLVGYENMVGISISSRNKEEAWKYVEYRLSIKASESKPDIPTKIIDFCFRMKRGGPDQEETVNGVNYYPITKEETEKMTTAFERAHSWPIWDRDIEIIIEEEAMYYFRNEKSLDEVIDIIESRVNIMLEENR